MKKIIIYVIVAIILIALVAFLGIYLTKNKEEQNKDIMSSFNIDFSTQDIKEIQVAMLTEGRKRRIYTYRQRSYK